jgi:hypothetical protein
MVSYINPECLESLTTKIEKKAYDLFKAKPGRPQLQVNRLFKTRTAEGKDIRRFEGNQDVLDVSHIRALEAVREPIFLFP